MASVHLAIRIQVVGTNDQVQAVADAVDQVQLAVEATGTVWSGGVQIALDPVAEVVSAPSPPSAPVPLKRRVPVASKHT